MDDNNLIRYYNAFVQFGSIYRKYLIKSFSRRPCYVFASKVVELVWSATPGLQRWKGKHLEF